MVVFSSSDFSGLASLNAVSQPVGGGQGMSDCDSKSDVGSFERSLGKLATAMANYFPFWLVLVSGAGLMHPPLLSWFQQEYVPSCLALTMLAMGTSITLEVRLHSCPRNRKAGRKRRKKKLLCLQTHKEAKKYFRA